jgi:hypothetical protein
MFKRILQLIATACLLILQSAALATPGDQLFSDDFEQATLAPNWTADNAARAGINTDTASSPTRSYVYAKPGGNSDQQRDRPDGAGGFNFLLDKTRA